MNKAVLRFTPLEYAYQEKYGIMPDTHYERLLEQTKNPKSTGETINKNMHAVWLEYRIARMIKEKNHGFTATAENPFEIV